MADSTLARIFSKSPASSVRSRPRAPGCGVGSGLFHQLHAELLAGGLHDGQTAGHGLISQMTGEGNVHEGVAAQLVSGADDQITTGHEVVVADQVGSGADLGQILVGLTGDADNVGAGFLDLAESLGGAGNSLVHDDGLHVGIRGQVHDVLDGGLQLLGEVVGIDGQRDHILAILRLESLGAAAVILRLRDGTGHDTDLVGAVLLPPPLLATTCWYSASKSRIFKMPSSFTSPTWRSNAGSSWNAPIGTRVARYS